MALGWITVLVLPMSARLVAQEPSKTIAEWWDAAYMQGARTGYVHTKVDEILTEGVKVYRGAVVLRLNIRRLNETVQLAILDHLSVLYIRIRESRQAVRLSSGLGSRAPAHCTGCGAQTKVYCWSLVIASMISLGPWM